MDRTTVYVIEIRGRAPSRLGGALAAFTRHERQGITILTGSVADSAALYGLLAHLESVGVPLVSVHPLADAPEEH